ncbi:MAG TPA: caspase family protein [Xanthobacteraceae bacterium]|nr:caspase family protein [Xanthobacteraceae bacterium]
MLTRLVLLCALFTAGLTSALAAAERRVALVIGNSNYEHAASLRNPRNDAREMADTLRKLGFKVLLGVDLDQQSFARTIDQFGRMLDDADVGLLFYAGHGLQINERNYLVSTNAQLASEFLIPAETIDLDSIIRLMESKTPINIVFLDACRNNPLAEDLRKNLAALNRSVSLGRGLARVETKGRDTLIAFAAAPGQEAADGNGQHSPFTTALLKRMPQPGVEVSVMLKQVAADVRELTRNNQRPQQISDMSRLFYFAKADLAPLPTPVAVVDGEQAKPAGQMATPAEDRQLDVAFWNAAQAADHCDAVKAYLRRFPNGLFVELARLSERRLCDPARRVAIGPNEKASAPAGNENAAPAAVSAEKAVQPDAEPPAVAPAKMAALPDKPAAPAATPRNPAELARNAQLELIRLGCGDIEADGEWGADSRKAVRLFNTHAKAKLDPQEPTEKLLAALRAKSDRVCPVTCGDGYRAKGNTCVAVKKPTPQKRRATRKSPERPPRVREVVREDYAPPAHPPRASVAPSVGLMLMYGAGRFRFRH